MNNKAILEVDVTAMGAGGTIIVDSLKNYSEIVLKGTVVLTGNINVTYSGTPYIGDSVILRNNASITTTVGQLLLFGSTVYQTALSLPFVANAIYATGGWSVVVSVSDILPNRISTWAIKDLAVTTAKIADLNVTTTKIADLNVTTTKVADGAITNIKLADLSVSTNKIQDNAVTTSKVLDNNITLSKLQAIPNNTILANVSGGAAPPSAIPPASLLSILGVVSVYTYEYLITSDGQSTVIIPATIGGVLLSVSREAQPLTLTDVRGASTAQISFDNTTGTFTFINGSDVENAQGQVLFITIKK